MSSDRWMDKENVVKVLFTQWCPTLWDPIDYSPPGFSVHKFSRQGYWNGYHFLLQGIYLTQGSNLGLPLCRQIFTIWATWEVFLYIHTHIHTHTHMQTQWSISHKENEILPFMTWMKLEGIMLNKISQEKDKYHMVLLVCGILQRKFHRNIMMISKNWRQGEIGNYKSRI